MTAEEMRSKIVDFVTTNGGALFYEIIDNVGVEARGNYIVSLADRKNVVLWTGVSQVFVEALHLAFSDLEYHRANPIMYAYFSDEVGFPNFPIVSMDAWSKNELDFSEPHWLPLVFFKKEIKNESIEDVSSNNNTYNSGIDSIHDSNSIDKDLDAPNTETQAG